MRQVVLDTETTGLDVRSGHRVIEIGCIELVERRPTGRTFHEYFNPGRAVEAGALAVHGITDEFLADRPPFGDFVTDFLAFIDGAELIAHNASFDIGFLDAELTQCDAALGCIADRARITDSLQLARQLYPGQRNTLDALCRRLGVDASHRELHGALLDAELLAAVYLEMTAGQSDLSLVVDDERMQVAVDIELSAQHRQIRVLRADEQEVSAHMQRLAAVDKASDGGCIWLREG